PVKTKNNNEVSLQSFEQLEKAMEEIKEKIKSTSVDQIQSYPEDERISIVIQNLTMTNKESPKVNMNFNAPVYGVSGNIEGNQVIDTSEQNSRDGT
ncbi:MAG: hypothetical protein AAGA80_24445, partial [Cyanobacteria bacterium P01_F01_bin.143]